MWISKKEWMSLKKRVADLERKAQIQEEAAAISYEKFREQMFKAALESRRRRNLQ